MRRIISVCLIVLWNVGLLRAECERFRECMDKRNSSYFDKTVYVGDKLRLICKNKNEFLECYEDKFSSCLNMAIGFLPFEKTTKQFTEFLHMACADEKGAFDYENCFGGCNTLRDSALTCHNENKRKCQWFKCRDTPLVEEHCTTSGSNFYKSVLNTICSGADSVKRMTELRLILVLIILYALCFNLSI